MSKLHQHQFVQRQASIISASVSDDVVLFDDARGKYFGISGVGAEIWGRLDEKIQVGVLFTDLQRDFDVDPSTCERDVIEFLERMRDADLIIVSQEDFPSSPATSRGSFA